jgi:hypothetical protein
MFPLPFRWVNLRYHVIVRELLQTDKSSLGVYMQRILQTSKINVTRRDAILESAIGITHKSTRCSLGAMDLWEDWARALPFTSGKDFIDVGEPHEVAFAADIFGGVRKIPEDFDGWEELARRIESNYVRGWVAKDGNRMFLWDNFYDVLTRKSGHFEYFEAALVRLQRRRYARQRTDLWDMGGQRYIGTLNALRLLVDLPTSDPRGKSSSAMRLPTPAPRRPPHSPWCANP